MRTLAEFNQEMLRTMQALGDEPSIDEVEAAGRELVKDGIPDGANLEGMLLLSDLARARAKEETRPNDDSRSRTREPRLAR